jgi:D-alanine-D-alanine ligase
MKKKLVGILYNQHSQEDDYYYIEADEAVIEEVNAIKKALTELGYNYFLIPFRKKYAKRVFNKILKHDWYCLVNLCESVDGKNLDQMQIPAFLDILRIPYTGSGPYSIALTTDKAATKGVLAACGLPVPKYRIISEINEIPKKLDFPVIVKPQFEDASVGIDRFSVVYNYKGLLKKAAELFKRVHQPLILEEYIDGREINVAIYEDDDVYALPLSEIIFEDFPKNFPRIVTYKAKWDKESWEEKQTRGVCPAELDRKVEKRIKEIAITAFNACKCRDYARVDIRLNESNEPFIIEVNANPDISPDAGFMRSWTSTGKTYIEFVEFIIEKAHQRNPTYHH